MRPFAVVFLCSYVCSARCFVLQDELFCTFKCWQLVVSARVPWWIPVISSEKNTPKMLREELPHMSCIWKWPECTSFRKINGSGSMAGCNSCRTITRSSESERYPIHMLLAFCGKWYTLSSQVSKMESVTFSSATYRPQQLFFFFFSVIIVKKM